MYESGCIHLVTSLLRSGDMSRNVNHETEGAGLVFLAEPGTTNINYIRYHWINYYQFFKYRLVISNLIEFFVIALPPTPLSFVNMTDACWLLFDKSATSYCKWRHCSPYFCYQHSVFISLYVSWLSYRESSSNILPQSNEITSNRPHTSL